MKTKTKKVKPEIEKQFRQFIADVKTADDVSDDLDEVGTEVPAEDLGFIRTEIVNGRGISFTCWHWTKPARALATKLKIKLPPDSGEQNDPDDDDDFYED